MEWFWCGLPCQSVLKVQIPRSTRRFKLNLVPLASFAVGPVLYQKTDEKTSNLGAFLLVAGSVVPAAAEGG